jgi:hypothetical protein
MSTFKRTMAFVGDLDDPFYDDERQRDVWNEASAVGFQLFLWASVIAAAILPWIAGTPGSWTAVGLLVAYGVIANATLAYSKMQGVDMQTSASHLRPRIIVFGALAVIAAIGAVYTLIPGNSVSEGFQHGVWVGGICGAAAGAVVAAVQIRRNRRKAAELDAAPEDIL